MIKTLFSNKSTLKRARSAIILVTPSLPSSFAKTVNYLPATTRLLELWDKVIEPTVGSEKLIRDIGRIQPFSRFTHGDTQVRGPEDAALKKVLLESLNIMQAFKTYHVTLVVFCLLACSSLSASMPVMADDSTQITALQNKVNALEKELILIKSLLKQNGANRESNARLEREIMLSARDKLTLKAGKSSLELSKDGRITLNGNLLNVKNSKDIEIPDSKIKDN